MNAPWRGQMSVKGDIESYIRSEFSTALGHVELEDETQLIETGIVDSLGIMKLLQFIQESYSIRIADDDLRPENFASLMAIASFIDARVPTP
jgi:acyl carrier protein